MKLPINKTTLALTSTALIVGGVIGMADISHKVNVKNNTVPYFANVAQTSQSGTITPAPDQPTPTDVTATNPAPTPTATNTATNTPDTTSPSPAEFTPAPTAAPTPPPPTRTNTTKTTRPSPSDPSINDFYCHYDYSDGTSNDVWSGSAPIDTQNGRVSYGFVCP